VDTCIATDSANKLAKAADHNYISYNFSTFFVLTQPYSRRPAQNVEQVLVCYICIKYACSWNIVVATMIRLQVERSGFRIPVRTKTFWSPDRPDRIRGSPSHLFGV